MFPTSLEDLSFISLIINPDLNKFIFWQQIWFQVSFYMEKVSHSISNQIFSLKCGFGIRFGIHYGIGRKYWPIQVSVLLSDLSQVTGFSRTLELHREKFLSGYPINPVEHHISINVVLKVSKIQPFMTPHSSPLKVRK